MNKTLTVLTLLLATALATPAHAYNSLNDKYCKGLRDGLSQDMGRVIADWGHIPLIIRNNDLISFAQDIRNEMNRINGFSWTVERDPRWDSENVNICTTAYNDYLEWLETYTIQHRWKVEIIPEPGMTPLTEKTRADEQRARDLVNAFRSEKEPDSALSER